MFGSQDAVQVQPESANADGGVANNNRDTSAPDEDVLSTTMSTRLHNAIHATIQKPDNNRPDMKKIIKQELTSFEASGVLGSVLTKMLFSLETIQPTSTESERVFSCASNICTKKRTRLSDKSLNAICFLKSYFINK